MEKGEGMELTQLKQFKVVAVTENMMDASERLYISQPALSRTIRKLEDEVEMTLFDRTDRRLKLNHAGKIVLGYTNLMLETEQKLLEALQVTKKQETIRFCTPFHAVLTYLLPDFCAQFPQIHLQSELNPHTAVKHLLTKNIYDIAVTNRNREDDVIKSEFLFRDYVYISVPESSRLYEKEYLTIDDIKDETFVSCITDDPLSGLIEAVFSSMEKKTILLSSLEACHSLAESYDFLFTATSITVNYTTFHKRRFIPLKKSEGVSYDYYASYRKEDQHKLRLLIEWMKVKGTELTL